MVRILLLPREAKQLNQLEQEVSLSSQLFALATQRAPNHHHSHLGPINLSSGRPGAACARPGQVEAALGWARLRPGSWTTTATRPISSIWRQHQQTLLLTLSALAPLHPGKHLVLVSFIIITMICSIIFLVLLLVLQILLLLLVAGAANGCAGAISIPIAGQAARRRSLRCVRAFRWLVELSILSI